MNVREEARAALANALRTINDDANYGDGGIDSRALGHIEEQIEKVLALLDEPVPTDEREALARMVEHQMPRFMTAADIARLSRFSPSLPESIADAILGSDVWRFRRQGPITDAAPEDPRRLIYEVKMMLSSVASHGPAALTTTSDRMYTANLLRRLSAALEAAEAAR